MKANSTWGRHTMYFRLENKAQSTLHGTRTTSLHWQNTALSNIPGTSFITFLSLRILIISTKIPFRRITLVLKCSAAAAVAWYSPSWATVTSLSTSIQAVSHIFIVIFSFSLQSDKQSNHGEIVFLKVTNSVIHTSFACLYNVHIMYRHTQGIKKREKCIWSLF